MKNYKTDSSALDIPWIESPFFNSLLENSNYTETEKELLIKYNKDGYIVLDLELDEEFVDTLMQGIFNELDKLGTQPL